MDVLVSWIVSLDMLFTSQEMFLNSRNCFGALFNLYRQTDFDMDMSHDQDHVTSWRTFTIKMIFILLHVLILDIRQHILRGCFEDVISHSHLQLSMMTTQLSF